jgi:hypothetical protein
MTGQQRTECRDECAHPPRRARLSLHWAINGCGDAVRHEDWASRSIPGSLPRVPSSGRCADPRHPQPVGAADLLRMFVMACGTTAPRPPRFRLSSSRPPRPGRLRRRCAIGMRRPWARRPLAGVRAYKEDGMEQSNGIFLIWQSMTAQVNGFLPSQEPDLWCGDGSRSLRSSREELVARTRSGVLARVPLVAGHLAGDCSVLL